MACAIQNFTTAECIASGIPVYNRYADIMLRPDLRKDVLMRGKLPNFLMYIEDLRTSLLGSGYRTVDTATYMWEEINYHNNPYVFTIEPANAVGAAGAPVTVTIARPLDGNEDTSAAVGFEAVTNVDGEQVWVLISDKTGDQLELTPINGQALDFTGKNYIFNFDPTVAYERSCTGSIQKFGFAQDQPQIGVGTIQEYEKGFCICQDTISHYAYNQIPDKFQMQDPLTGQMVDTWCLPSMIQDRITKEMFYGQFFRMMFGQRDNIHQRGTEGLIPTLKARGGYNFSINTSDPNSLIASLKVLALEYNRLGIEGFDLWVDTPMYININEAIARLVGKKTPDFPVWKGDTDSFLDWYGFKGINNFLGIDMPIRINRIKGWEAMQYDSIIKNFAILMPNMNYRSSTGGEVPLIETVKLRGCTGYEIAPTNGMGSAVWIDDARRRGERHLDVYARNQYGYDFHGVPFMGLLGDKNVMCNV